MYYRFSDGTRWRCADFDARSEQVVLDVARLTTGAPVWHGYQFSAADRRQRGTGWQIFTGWGETFESVRATRWPRPQ